LQLKPILHTKVLSFQLRKSNKTDKLFSLTFEETKKAPELIAMLRDIREIGLLGDIGNEKLDVRIVAMTPYAKAIESNLTAFFQMAKVEDIVKVIEFVRTWEELDSKLCLAQYIAALKRVTHKWTLYQGRRNIKTKAFVKAHLMNIVTKWPDTVEPEERTPALHNTPRKVSKISTSKSAKQ
jgi:hypothetical protein